MATLHFDFHPLPTRPGALGMVLLGAGLLMLGASLFTLQRANQARESQITALTAFEQAQQKRRPSRVRASRSPSIADAAQVAQARVRASLDYSWQPAFAALEATHNQKIALLSLEASQAKSQLRLTAEARRLADAVDYAERLSQQAGVKRTALLQHQVQEKDAQHPVRFTLLMEMRP
jgi:hypothetical protein